MEDDPISKTRQVILWVMIAGVLLLIGLAVTKVIVYELRPRHTIVVGSSAFKVDIADTPRSRERGLSGRRALERGEAMLLVFDSDKEWGIWMKDMKFPIDIVWIGKDKTISHIEHNVQPDSPPHKVYTSPVPSRYVLEIASGQARQSGMGVGTKVKFEDKIGG